MAERIGLDAVRELMRRYLDDDSDRRSVEVEGVTLEAALQNAAIQLDSPISRIEYEVLEKGASGLAGFGRKPWKISAYESSQKKQIKAVADTAISTDHAVAIDIAPVVRDRDGEVFVRLATDGALIKVVPPMGKGRRATVKQALERLQARVVTDIDTQLVQEAVNAAAGTWLRVGSFIANPAADALLTVDIGAQEMDARITILPPQAGGCDLSKDIMTAYLRNNKVVFGTLDEVLQELENKPRYKEPIVVAQGQRPQNGDDSRMQFMFEVDRSKLHIEEKDGKIDYKELHLVQNVVEGQALARKIPPKSGIPGRTVTGKLLPARNGKDISLPLGKNVHASEDGLTIIADVNGEATFINNKINVETVYTIAGDVDLKTGNQFFLGTIIVNGNIEDGFSVKATGNVEVKGNVGKSEVSAEGDVIIHQGITGKGSGMVTAGKNLWAKFIENAQVVAGNNVIVTQSIINSDVTADKRIICAGGKHAAIIGGRYRACEEINAKSIGTATGGAETILEVGSDPKSKARLDDLTQKMTVIGKQKEDLEKNIMTLNDLKRHKKTLSEEKQAILEELLHRHVELRSEFDMLKGEHDSLQLYLNNLKVRGKVSVSGRIYPGAKIIIRDVKEDIKNEHKALTFYLDNMLIKSTKYEEVDEGLLKRGSSDVD
jgi:hypothetical protein